MRNCSTIMATPYWAGKPPPKSDYRPIWCARCLMAPYTRLPPGEKHWHGAAPTTAMTHIAIQEQLDGRVVDWMEHVTDAQYLDDSGGR